MFVCVCAYTHTHSLSLFLSLSHSHSRSLSLSLSLSQDGPCLFRQRSRDTRHGDTRRLPANAPDDESRWAHGFWLLPPTSPPATHTYTFMHLFSFLILSFCVCCHVGLRGEHICADELANPPPKPARPPNTWLPVTDSADATGYRPIPSRCLSTARCTARGVRPASYG